MLGLLRLLLAIILATSIFFSSITFMYIVASSSDSCNETTSSSISCNSSDYHGSLLIWSFLTVASFIAFFVTTKLYKRKYSKIILVDAVHTLVNKDGEPYKDVQSLIKSYKNHKILLTNADDEKMKSYGLHKLNLPIFSLKHEPNKDNPEYYKKLIKDNNLPVEKLVYFEHDEAAVKSARSVGIKTYLFDANKRDIGALKQFLDANL